MLGKLIYRILLIALALVTVPLAIQNRAPVTVILDPTVLLAGEPRLSFTLPLFVALLLALGLGLTVGYAVGKVTAGRRQSQRRQSADALAADALAARALAAQAAAGRGGRTRRQTDRPAACQSATA